ncbi:site-specific integrase [Vibrio mediterranei]|uniref:site-specific integrase n=1 Tax=Vibrio mediterranei TaxID=689 RepID=UPI00148DE14C|nr:site-specific integrase [Vibrio mediterranei]NOI25941.1 site-specific integrase [Vibrio mediterranei]
MDFFVMKYKVEKITVKGEQFIVFTDEDCSPVTGNHTINWANAYIEKEKSANKVASRETEAKHLLFCLEHFIKFHIDVANRVKSAQFFTSVEISNFVSHCFRKADVIKSENGNITPISIKNIDSPAYQSAAFADSRVRNTTASARMLSMKSFISYLYKRFHAVTTKKITEIQYERVTQELTREINKAKRENSRVIDVDKPIFSDNLLETLFTITQVGHPDNPFKSSQLRNRVILETIFDTGMRRGALLQLKTTDLRDENIERIHIEQRVNIDDPRHHRPTQKTRSAQVAVEPKIMDNIKNYIDKERTKYPSSESHDFIFISEWGMNSGQPLSITGLNYIFKVLSNKLSNSLGANINISPHMIRHHWNKVFTERAESAGLTNIEIDRLRKQMMTWSSTSNMSETYNIWSTLKRVREIKQRYQHQLTLKGNN